MALSALFKTVVFFTSVVNTLGKGSGLTDLGGLAVDVEHLHSRPPVLRDISSYLLSEEDNEVEAACEATGEASGGIVAQDAGDPYLMALRREATPVYRRGEVVSFKTSYSGVLNMGVSNPSQVFRVVFDTGSGHVVVPSSSCTSETCVAHRRYNVSKSTSGHSINMNGSPVQKGKARDQVSIGFGTGKIVGRFVLETVCLGSGHRGTDEESQEHGPCVEMKAISAISMTPQPFQSFKFDGIVGLGLSALTLGDSFSFFDMLLNASAKEGGVGPDHPSRSLFGVYLAEGTGGAGEVGEDASEIAFGGYNPKRILEPLKWTPVAMKELGYWQVEILGVRVGNTTLDICKVDACRGIVDTGTSHLGVPGSVYEEVALGVTVPAGDVKNCLEAQAPDIEILLDGFSLTLRPQDYMRVLPLAPGVNPGARIKSDDQAFSEPEQVVGADLAHGGTTCRPKLMPVNLPAPLGPNLFLLGEPVLKRYYTAFNWKELRVGFATAAKPLVMQGDGSVLFQTEVGVVQTEEADDIMWEGDDNSFMVQMSVSVDEVADDEEGQLTY